VKVGDLVYLIGEHPEKSSRVLGLLIAPWAVGGWCQVLVESGKITAWPVSQLELVE
jgi:hypothetical protein